MKLNELNNIVKNSKTIGKIGRITEIIGLTIVADGPSSSIGDLCHIVQENSDEIIYAEVVGFKQDCVLLMPLGSMEGLCAGAKVINTGTQMKVKVSPTLLGRVLDGLGNPIDGKGEIIADDFYPINAKIINPMERKPIDEPLPLGLRAIDGFNTIGKGQRVGIFAGSGVGKSTTLAMIAKNASSDINVIALIGERGREVREFIENTMGTEGMKRSIVICATSEQPALVKIKASFVACAIAEYFRDKGKNVLFMLDSVTRIALAQREVGLAVGEPPATRGYTPSVFALLPKFLERAGANKYGTITGLYTVLVEGDDMNEPIADAARSILDGHIVLSRALAHKNHYPAIDVLASISRVMSNIADDEHKSAAGKIRNLMASYAKNEDLINIGAYAKGSDATVDKAIMLHDKINAYLQQKTTDTTDFEITKNELINLAKM
ncbi:MAG: flagellar protein export ATPase FliI [Candidatus Gastranaerophilales bacterium]|nr:flagellar protein export ATPase FliI [Candidatus Gastranaerophilales bacterium]